MEFGYFTLSDNHYRNNPRTANDFVLEIREQALLADKLGYHSCWIGEHHFDSLGVNSRPDLVLASIAPLTKHVRLAPAVSVLPPVMIQKRSESRRVTVTSHLIPPFGVSMAVYVLRPAG